MFQVQGKVLIAQRIQGLRKFLAALPCQCPDVLSSSRVFTERHLDNWLILLRKRRRKFSENHCRVSQFSGSSLHCTIISHLMLRNNCALSSCVRSHSVWNCGVVELSVTKTKTNKQKNQSQQEPLKNAQGILRQVQSISQQQLPLIRFQTQICPPGSICFSCIPAPYATLLWVPCSQFLLLLSL